jgi:multidrug efflux pump subunit AcrA (membrane-fusion protein)
MKKWLVVVALAAVIGGVWYVARTKFRYTPIWFQPKFGQVTRGDISVPISAAGLIEPNQKIEIKSKASGEVIEVPVKEGTFVKRGDVLLVLKKDDEQRNFDSAEADVARSKALLEQAKIAVERAEVSIQSAGASIDRAAAQCASSAYELKKVADLKDGGKQAAYSEQEYVVAKASHDANLAAKKMAEAELAQAEVSRKDAVQAVALQEAAVRVAESSYGNAKQRLDETTIIAKYDAIVTEVRAKVSEVIQGGINTFTGGTPVMYLADVSRKKVVARLDESDYGRVLKISPVDALPEMPGLQEAVLASAEEIEKRAGKVKLTVDAFPEESFTGVIERVEPQGKLNAGSAVIQYNVHVAITDPNANKLPLGAQAQVEFTVESARDTLRVPADAVKSYQGQRGVYVQIEPEPGSNDQWGKKFIACRFGITDGEFTQVIEALGGAELTPDQKVYTKLPVDNKEKGEL